MTVQQVIDLVKNGELKNVHSSDAEILGYLNLGMLDLYKKFEIKVEEHIITLVDGTTIYDMPEDYMWIVAAYEEVPEDAYGSTIAPIPINKEDDPKSINVIGWSQVQIPTVTSGGFISVIYVASPTMYEADGLDVRIAIPVQMIEALLAFISYKAYNSIDTGVQTGDNIYYQRYLAICKELQDRAMFTSDDVYMADRIVDKGFV